MDKIVIAAMRVDKDNLFKSVARDFTTGILQKVESSARARCRYSPDNDALPGFE